MARGSATRDRWINERALRFGNRPLPHQPVVVEDTTHFMAIERDHIIDLEGNLFLVQCNEREGRFGLEDQPKFWVKRAIDLETGRTHILKLVFHEEFKIKIGALEARCTRSPEKEGRVLDVVRGDARFMQGRSALDTRGNLVRVIDFIPGVDLLSYLHTIQMSHEQYASTLLPGILTRIVESCRAIERLHDCGLCHGDIRNDHLLIERETGSYKWIDFDLNQDFSDFDVWSIGNILHCVAGKGFVTFRDAVRIRPGLSGRLCDDDASVFFPHRLMNLRKVFPWIPERLNRVLLRFSAGAEACYERVSEISSELSECLESMGRPHET